MSMLRVSSSPHIRSKQTTTGLMLDVIFALIPCVIASIVIFGTQSLLIIAVSIATCLLSEYLCNKVMKRKNTLRDLSAVVTGLIFALTLPVGISLFVVAIGAAFSIVVVKQLFGGLGHNFMNPALGGRAFMMISFAAEFSKCYPPTAVDALASATPLAESFQGNLSVLELALGNYGGALGETCKFAILLGLIYLLVRKVITWRIPTIMLGSAAVLMLILGENPITGLLTGGIMFGAVFMATDYVTNPVKPLAQMIFAAGCGIITVVIRHYGAYPEGTMFAIMLMNIAAPLIDRLVHTKVFGEVKKAK